MLRLAWLQPYTLVLQVVTMMVVMLLGLQDIWRTLEVAKTLNLVVIAQNIVVFVTIGEC